MGGIEITAHHNGLALSQFFRVFKKTVIEPHLELQPLITHLAVGEIYIEKMEIRIFEVQHPPFIAKTLIRQADIHLKRLRIGKTGNP